MSTVNNNSVDAEAKKLQKEYGELKLEIATLLSMSSKQANHRIIGVFTTAGSMVEKVLLLMIKRENREKSLQALETRQYGIFEYRKILNGIIPKQQIIHINTIGQWRNHVAHANDLDTIAAEEISSVNLALKSFIEWFFEDYLKYNLSDLVTDQAGVRHLSAQNVKHNQINVARVIPVSRKKLVARWVFMLSIFASILISIGYIIYLPGKAADSAPKPIIQKLSDEQAVYKLLLNYYSSISDQKFDAYDFFASKVSTYILEKNVDPTKINVLHQINREFVDTRSIIDKQSLYLSERTDSVDYWRFWNAFSCYRTSKRKFESCKVLMEFGLNSEGKITSIKEIRVIGLKFTKLRPSQFQR